MSFFIAALVRSKAIVFCEIGTELNFHSLRMSRSCYGLDRHYAMFLSTSWVLLPMMPYN